MGGEFPRTFRSRITFKVNPEDLHLLSSGLISIRNDADSCGTRELLVPEGDKSIIQRVEGIKRLVKVREIRSNLLEVKLAITTQNQFATEVEIKSFLRCFNKSRGVYLSQYRAANGNFFSADLVKELFPCYTGSKGGRDRFASLVHPYSHEEGEVGKFIFESLLEETSGTVTCVEGGSGVGKSCYEKRYRKNKAELWIETTTCFPQLVKTLGDAHRPIKILHLHGSPEDNIRSAIFRALVDGRRVPLKALIGTSANSTHKLAMWLRGDFRDIKGIDITVEIVQRDFSQNDSEFFPLSFEDFLKFARAFPEMVPDYSSLHQELVEKRNVEFPEVRMHYLQELEGYII